jgi:hypothetical protein
LQYFVGTGTPYVWEDLKDSVLFLPKSTGVNICLIPLNPLNYIYKTSLTFIIDEIDAARDESLTNLRKILGDAIDPTVLLKGKSTCTDFDHLVASAIAIADKLDNSKKEQCIAFFTRLKDLTFEKELQTKDSLKVISSDIDKIQGHFDGIKSDMISLANSLIKYDDTKCLNPFVVRSIFDGIISKFKSQYESQLLSLKNLKKAYGIVLTAYTLATTSETSLNWIIDVTHVPIVKGKVAIQKIAILEAGYSTNKDNEISVESGKEIINRHIRFRPFRRFIFEGSAGIAYANITFPRYSTTTDPTGKLIVSEAGEDRVRRFNFTTMMNWNYYVRYSDLVPFLQIGAGINAGYPSMLAGIGVRVSGNGPAIAISVGFASTWVKSLNKLKVGDAVTGDAELEKDLRYDFNWPPRPYVGIQLRL